MKKETLFISISNQKGGVGKSVISTLIASYLHLTKKKNVAVIDCDYPQYSIFNMREDDRKTIYQSQDLQVALTKQFDKYDKKAYPIIKATTDNALEEAINLIKSSESKIDVIFFDLPGTVNNPGILNVLLTMNFVFIPVIADKRILQSSLAFMLLLKEYINAYSDKISLKKYYAFWNKVDKREHTELYADFKEILVDANIPLLKTELPDTKKYNKELSIYRTAVFRSTLFPPDARQLRRSNIDKLIKEISNIIKL
ncbi:ParA family protein [Dysgonomonas sp. ZJ709]|uniref:ParA family protein n=1 Tax=Dysgonomonas sp. ZJ709 TaxID=2709797 RepID=UPI0013ED32BF|nr:ParA family protein [Dysgonomonas sp. ZJ709]